MSSLLEFCPQCASTVFQEVILPESHIHYGEVICTNCSKHIKWLRNPKVTDEFKARESVIDAALGGDRVTGWENMFFRNIRNRRYLTPKQQEKYEQICSRHGLTENVSLA